MDIRSETHPSPEHDKIESTPISTFVVLAVWLSMTIILFAKLAIYAQTSGGIGTPPMATVAGIQLESDRHTLVVAIHPKCPCTQSTFYELERLVLKVDRKIDITFFVYTSRERSDAWFADTAGKINQKFPDASVINDLDGELSTKLGARVSGSTVLYNPNGDPVFWGGVTTGRGHTGDNVGSDSIIKIVQGHKTTHTQAPVYGCDLTTNNIYGMLGSCSNEMNRMCQEIQESRNP